MTWDICIGIIALAGFIITIGKIISANTQAITRLEDTINRLDDTLSEQKKELIKIDEEVQEHEIRITVLEARNER